MTLNKEGGIMTNERFEAERAVCALTFFFD